MDREQLIEAVKATVCGDREQTNGNTHKTLAIVKNKQTGVITNDYSIL